VELEVLHHLENIKWKAKLDCTRIPMLGMTKLFGIAMVVHGSLLSNIQLL